MQQIIINIDNPKIEALLSDISQQDNISVDDIISKLIEEYIYLYPTGALRKQSENFEFPLDKTELLQQFEELNIYNKNLNFEVSEDIDISKLANEVNDAIL